MTFSGWHFATCVDISVTYWLGKMI